MLNYVKGDITTTPDSVILHGVNCQGKFNAGVAKALRHKFPSVVGRYQNVVKNYDNPKDLLGTIAPVQIRHQIPPKYVIHCFTQLNYGREKDRVYVDYDAILCCLINYYNWHQALSLANSVSMPKIGCGLGGGDWSIVQGIVQKQLVDRGVTVNVWEL